MIALTSVWFYRRELMASGGRRLITAGLPPLLSRLFNLVIFGYGLKTQGTIIAVVTAVGIMLGFAVRAKARSETLFTSGGDRTEVPETADAVALPGADN